MLIKSNVTLIQFTNCFFFFFARGFCTVLSDCLPTLIIAASTKIAQYICGIHRFYIHKGQTCPEHALLPFPSETSDEAVKIEVSIGKVTLKMAKKVNNEKKMRQCILLGFLLDGNYLNMYEF